MCAPFAHDSRVRAVHNAPVDYDWFKARKAELKLTDAAIATAAARERSVVNKAINGSGVLPVERADELAELFKTSRADMLYRMGVLRKADLVADQPPARSIDNGEVVEIVKLDLSLPMGPGAVVDDFVEEEKVLFDLSYVRSFTRTPPYRLRLAGGAGDSMFPTLVPNDLVWIDTTQNQLLHADRIYAASINGGAAIKRLRPVAGGARVLVISDNKLVEPYEVDKADIRIWGRVIRFARDL